MESIIIFIHVIAAIGITGLVLIQQGKGADMGASFGSGASQTIFGSSGSGNALSKSTSLMATVFFITSLGLAIIARQQADLSVQDSGLIENLDELSTQAPAGLTNQDIPGLQASSEESDIPFAISEDASDLAEDIPVTQTGETTE